ncbi:helix-turn-helix domain-containing protein [Microbacterium sediminicola]
MAIPRLLTQAEVADILGVSVRTVENWRERCVGPDYVRLVGSVRYTEQAIEAYIAQRTVSTPPRRW